MGNIIKIPIDAIIVSGDLYPRTGRVEAAIQRYASAMKRGDVFPPIRVGRIHGEQITYLVDGFHRLNAALQIGEKYVKAEIKYYKILEDLYIDAVRLNVTHGQPFEQSERMLIATRLRKSGHSAKEVSDILKMALEDIEKITIRTIAPKSCKVCRKISPESAEEQDSHATRSGVRKPFSISDYDDQTVGEVAEALHKQWQLSSTALLENARISEGKLKHLKSLWVPYKDLPEADQIRFREKAKEILGLVEANCLQRAVPVIARSPA